MLPIWPGNSDFGHYSTGLLVVGTDDGFSSPSLARDKQRLGNEKRREQIDATGIGQRDAGKSRILRNTLRCRTERHDPGVFSRVEIQRGDPAVGWLQDRQALDGELGSGSTREAHIRLRIVCDGNDARTRLGRNIKVIGLRIEAAALPKRTPGTAGIVPGALSAVFLDLRRRRRKADRVGTAWRF